MLTDDSLALNLSYQNYEKTILTNCQVLRLLEYNVRPIKLLELRLFSECCVEAENDKLALNFVSGSQTVFSLMKGGFDSADRFTAPPINIVLSAASSTQG